MRMPTYFIGLIVLLTRQGGEFISQSILQGCSVLLYLKLLKAQVVSSVDITEFEVASKGP
jgi:hypothetical protein